MLQDFEFREQIKAWAKSNRWDLIRKSARMRMEAKGYINLGLQSFTRWIEPEWLERAIKMRAVQKNPQGAWLLIVEERDENQAIGRRGMSAIFKGEKRTKLTPESEMFMRLYRAYQNEKQTAYFKNHQMTITRDFEEIRSSL